MGEPYFQKFDIISPSEVTIFGTPVPSDAVYLPTSDGSALWRRWRAVDTVAPAWDFDQTALDEDGTV